MYWRRGQYRKPGMMSDGEGDLVGNLCREVMVCQGGNEAYHRMRKTQTDCHQVRIAHRRQFHQSVDTSGKRIEDTLIAQLIQLVARDSQCERLAHAELSTMCTNNIFRSSFHHIHSDK